MFSIFPDLGDYDFDAAAIPIGLSKNEQYFVKPLQDTEVSGK